MWRGEEETYLLKNPSFCSPDTFYERKTLKPWKWQRLLHTLLVPVFPFASAWESWKMHTDITHPHCFWSLAQSFYPKRRHPFLSVTALVEEGVNFGFLTWVMGLSFLIQSRSKLEIIMKHDKKVTKSFLLIRIPIILWKLILFCIICYRVVNNYW